MFFSRKSKRGLKYNIIYTARVFTEIFRKSIRVFSTPSSHRHASRHQVAERRIFNCSHSRRSRYIILYRRIVHRLTLSIFVVPLFSKTQYRIYTRNKHNVVFYDNALCLGFNRNVVCDRYSERYWNPLMVRTPILLKYNILLRSYNTQ